MLLTAAEAARLAEVEAVKRAAEAEQLAREQQRDGRRTKARQ